MLMSYQKRLYLLGNHSSRERAKCILEDQPYLKRILPSSSPAVCTLILSEPVQNDALILLLSQSGLDGIMIR